MATQRAVPGSGPLAQQNKNKKKSNGSPVASNMAKAAHAAALTPRAPASVDKVDKNVKVQPEDVAEEAERQAALATADIVAHKDGTLNGHHAEGDEHESAKTSLQAIIAKRIKVLNKKLQRAIVYEALDQSTVNNDQRRIIASKQGLEASVAELTEVAKALELAEAETRRSARTHERRAIATATEVIRSKNKKTLATLFQFMHLNSFIVPNGPTASFMPPPMSPVLEKATGQEMAAVGKLHADLSASGEVVPLDVKATIVDRLVRGSTDTVLDGVSYSRIADLIEGLSAPGTEQTAPAPTATASSGPEASEPPAASHISFMQASELGAKGPATADAPFDVTQAEPEGGAVDSVPQDVVGGGASGKGRKGASGPVLGGEAPAATADSQNDGSANAAVEEPVRTTETAKAERAAPMHKVIDWAANDDDDDFGDLAIQPEAANNMAVATRAVAPARTASGPSPHTSKGRNEKASGPRRSSGGGHGHGRDAAKTQRSLTQSQQAPAPAAAKASPEVDDDGFTVASSKRSKFLLERQQQQQQQQRGRGGRRGGAGPSRGGRRPDAEGGERSNGAGHGSGGARNRGGGAGAAAAGAATKE